MSAFGTKSIQWSDEQQKVISSRGQNMLVAAAAGSGKTAVLVERIIQKITTGPERVDVDQLLVVTFTNAAAAEMKARISQALEEMAANDPSSVHLRQQLTLMGHASICTLHSFCIDVLHRYYYEIGLDPAFRVMEETESALMREEIIETLFEEQYGDTDNEAFYRLVDCYSGDRSDVALQTLVEKLYDLARCHPQPEEWLDEMIVHYDIPDGTRIDDLPWVRDLLGDIVLHLQQVKGILNKAKPLMSAPGGPALYRDNFAGDEAVLDDLIACCRVSWSTVYEAFGSFQFGRLKNVKGEEYDEALKEQVQDIRNKVKDEINQIKKAFFSRRPELFLEDLREMAPHMKTLAHLVKKFGQYEQKMKQEKGLVDFSDLEHYCLAILSDSSSDSETFLPSDAALDYRKAFSEVLVDEYQDINLVQEAILQLVTKENNLFMVGDVKQSIYRFRLAEPRLFIEKYQSFQKDGNSPGLRIDLTENFRSRKEVIHGVNFLFRQMMSENIGEMNYGRDVELRPGFDGYFEEASESEVILIDRDEEQDGNTDSGTADLQKEQLEARLIVRKIQKMIADRYEIYDTETKKPRPLQYRDMVVLLRSASRTAPIFLEAFRRSNIPCYVELSGGYFEAIEVKVMMALLKIIDNPRQDIPLASVLRSPIVGLKGEELAKIRICHQKGSYYEAFLTYMENKKDKLAEKLKGFSGKLQSWRKRARQGSLSELIWQIFRETGYYEFTAGMPGGRQRQANLRALYDRARQYENTSFRGLFRFLRFVERMRDRGSDLGTARALGEQEDVVRVMTVHKSKGLEYPVVFVAGINKNFNLSDMNGLYVLDKELGLGTKMIQPESRISYPTLLMLAIKQKIKRASLSEEMRVLYVALTRAREKLFLVGTVKDTENTFQKWGGCTTDPAWLLPDDVRAGAKSCLDWIGPALIRHRDGKILREAVGIPEPSHDVYRDPSQWNISIIKADGLKETVRANDENKKEIEQALRAFQPVPFESDQKQEVNERLSWVYDHSASTVRMSKQTVSEMKRQREMLTHSVGSDTVYVRQFQSPIAKRPRFMREKQLSSAERGTVVHRLMQHINLGHPVTMGTIHNQLAEMVTDELLTVEEAKSVDTDLILHFFQSDIGKRLQCAKTVKREVPFSLAMAAGDAYAHWQGSDETVIVQGVIDCLIEEPDGFVLLDYKTDEIRGQFPGGFAEAGPVLQERYRVQLDMYEQAVRKIWKKSLKEKYLYFFDGGHLLPMTIV